MTNILKLLDMWRNCIYILDYQKYRIYIFSMRYFRVNFEMFYKYVKLIYDLFNQVYMNISTIPTTNMNRNDKKIKYFLFAEVL